MFDVSAFRSVPGGGPATQVLADELDSGRIVDGMAKLVQRVILELMTVQGSIPQSTAGCSLVKSLTTGRVATELDVFMLVAAAIGTVVQNITAAQTAADSVSEQLASIQVSSLQLSAGSLALTLNVKNQAGVVSQVVLPLDFLLN